MPERRVAAGAGSGARLRTPARAALVVALAGGLVPLVALAPAAPVWAAASTTSSTTKSTAHHRRHRHSTLPPPPAGPPVELVETRPVETTLGNPTLPSATETWISLIHSARHTIDLEEFYLSTWPEEPLDGVLGALGSAVQRGVKIRLLLDARMYRTYPRVADSLAKVPGWSVRLVPWARIAGGVQHSKYFVVDRTTSFVGSQNLDWRALKHIHELGVRIRDPRVATELEHVFEMDWAEGYPVDGEPDTTRVVRASAVAHAPGMLPFRIVQSPGDTVLTWIGWTPRKFCPDTTWWDRDRIIAMLDAARRTVVVQSLTYGTEGYGEHDDALDQALRRAAARGVRVRLIISDWEMGSRGMGDLQALSKVPNVEVKLGTVPPWSGGYIPFGRVEHCKYAVVDSLWTWVGTSNWEPSYFTSNRNIGITMKNRPIALSASRIFEASWVAPGAHPIAPDSTYAPKIRGDEPPPGMKKYGG